MPVLEEVVVVLSANTEQYVAEMQGVKAEMATVGEQADIQGRVAGAGLSDGIGKGLGKTEKDIKGFDNTTEHLGKSAEGSSKKLGLFGSAIGSLGGPFGEAQQKAGSFRGELDRIASSGGIAGKIVGALSNPYIAAGVAVAGATAVVVNYGVKQQEAAAKVAVSANISTAAAAQIADAMTKTGGTYTAQQMTLAYAKVAGSLGLVNGAALSTKQSVDFMTHAVDLSEASGVDLSKGTKALSDVMVAYHIKTGKAAEATNVLFNAARLTGTPVNNVAMMLQRMHSMLGAVTPPLAETGGLMLDLSSHGISGRGAIMAVTAAFQKLLAPQGAVQVAQIKVNSAMAQMDPTMKQMVKAYNDGSLAGKALKQEVNSLDVAHQQLWKTFQKSDTALQTAKSNYSAVGIQLNDAKGKFVGMDSVIGQLNVKLKGHTQAQQLAILQMVFGASANRKFLDTILAGPKAYEAYVKKVKDSQDAHKAAEKATDTLKGQVEKLHKSMSDLATRIGEKVLPVVVALANFGLKVLTKAFDIVISAIEHTIHFMEKIYDWFKKGSLPALALGGVLTLILAPAFVGLAITATTAIAGIIASMATSAALMAMYAAEWVAGLYTMAIETVANYATMIASAATWLASLAASIAETMALWAMYAVEHTVAAAVFIAENVAMAASAVAAFIAENIATLGIITVIMLLVGAVIYVATHWKQTWALIVRIAKDTANWVKDAFVWLWHHLVTIFDDIKNAVVNAWNDVVSWLKGLPQKILDVLLAPDKLLFDIGKKIITGLWDGMKSIWKDVTNWFSSALSWLGFGGSGNKTVNVVNGQSISRTSGLGSFGGVSPSGVGTASAPSSPHTSSVLNVTTPIQIDGRTLATAVTQYQLQNARGTGNALGRYAGGSQTATATGISAYAVPRG